MRIAIISDTHDNIWALETAMEHLSVAEALLHCGDLCSPFVLKQLIQGMAGKPIHIVWGNNDGDQLTLTRIASQAENVHLHGHIATLQIGSLRISMVHYPESARRLAEGGRYDLVCYGHDHTAHHERIGGVTLLNPGEVMGLYGKRSIAIYDSETRSAEHIQILQARNELQHPHQTLR
jgi:hypothetical protein